MAQYSYVSTFVIEDDIVNLSVDGTQLLSNYMTNQTYICVAETTSAATQFIIDLSRFLLFEANITFTNSLSNWASSLTDLQVNGYQTTNLPLLDQNTNGYDHRLNVYDAYTKADVCVQYTSINDTSLRDDLYSRSQLNDLVLSSPQGSVDFTNAFVAVNGIVQRSYFFENELYVMNGFSNIKNSKQNRVVVYDTTELGGHTLIPINDANIDASNNNLFAGVTLSFPDQDFTGTTILLVLGGYLYVLDDTYQMINKNRLKINTSKIDFINQFLHNPNTLLVKNNINIVEDAVSSTLTPNVVDEITYYLTEIYPQASINPPTSVNLLAFTLPVFYTPPSVTTQDMLSYYLLNYPYQVPTGAQAMFGQYPLYVPPDSIVVTLPTSELNDSRYIYSVLTAVNSFLIVINNPAVYKRNYNLNRTYEPSQYIAISEDTPRGILKYNDMMALPYLTFAEADHRHHDFSIGYNKSTKDVYKSIINPEFIPSPRLDVKADLKHNVNLIELYSP